MLTKMIKQYPEMRTNKNLLLTAIVMLAMFFSTVELSAQKEIPDNIKDHITKGIEAFGNAKMPVDVMNALIEFDAAEKLAPDFADVHYYLGKTYSMIQGNSGTACKELKKYLKLYPDAPEKDEVINEIKRLDKVVEEKRLSSISGVGIMTLKDGIYIISKAPVKTGSENFDTRLTAVSVQPGDKLISVLNTGITKNTPIDEVLSLICNYPKPVVPVKVIRGGVETSALLSKVSFTNIDNITYLGEEDLKSVLTESTVPVVLIFWKVDDPGCNKYVGDLKAEAQKLNGSVKFYVVNIDESMLITYMLNITEVPTLLFFKGGNLKGKITQYQPELFKEKAESISTDDKSFGL